jgi:hypothetical protein
MKKRKQFSTNKNRPNVVINTRPDVKERGVGAASVGASTVVVDRVKPITTAVTAVNIPFTKGFKTGLPGVVQPTIVSNKQDRKIDRQTIGISRTECDNPSPLLSGQDLKLAFSGMNNVSVIAVPTMINMKPEFVNETVETVNLGSETVYSAEKTFKELHYAVRQILTDHDNPLIVSDIMTFNSQGQMANEVHLKNNGSGYDFIVDSGKYFYVVKKQAIESVSETLYTVSSNSDTGYGRLMTDANNAFIELQSQFAKFPAFYSIEGINSILVQQDNVRVYFYLPTNAYDGVHQASINPTVPSNYTRKLVPMDKSNFDANQLDAGSNFIRDIANQTPGNSEYSNADIAIAKTAVKFRAMAISRNDTINPCYTAPIQVLSAMIKSSTMKAANAQIALHQVRALQELAEITEPFWPSWYNSVGAAIRSKGENIDKALTALESNLAGIRVHNEIYHDLVNAHTITRVPQSTEGSLKVIIPVNDAFQATAQVSKLLFGGVAGAPLPTIGAGYCMVQEHESSALVDISSAEQSVDELITYIHTIAAQLPSDKVMTLNAATACYTLLTDVQLEQYPGLDHASVVVALHNSDSKHDYFMTGENHAYRFASTSESMMDRKIVDAGGLQCELARVASPSLWVANPNDIIIATKIARDYGYVEADLADQTVPAQAGGTYNVPAMKAVAEAGIKKVYEKTSCLPAQLTAALDFSQTYRNSHDGYDVINIGGVAWFKKENDYDTFIRDFTAEYSTTSERQAAARREQTILFTSTGLSYSAVANNKGFVPFEAYFAFNLVTDLTEFNIVKNIPGQFRVVSTPTMFVTKAVSHNKSDKMVTYDLSPIYLSVYAGYADRIGQCGGGVITRQYKLLRAIYGSFGLNCPSTVISNTYTVTSVNDRKRMPLFYPDLTEFLGMFSMAPNNRAFLYGDLNTAKLQKDAAYSTKYLLD